MKKESTIIKSPNIEFKKSSVLIRDNELSSTHNEKFSTFSNAMAGSKIAKLQDRGAYYLSKKEKEIQRSEELQMIIEAKEKELKKKRDDILNAKKSYDGNDPLTLSKKIKNLDMKLEKLRQKHNEALADNVQLRDKINSLRSEKNIFDKIHDKLSLELKQKDEDYDRLKKESEKAKMEIYSVKKNLDEARKTVFKEQKDLEKEYQSIYDLLNRENRDDRIKDTREKKKKEDEFKKSQQGSPKMGHKNDGTAFSDQAKIRTDSKFYLTQYDGLDSPKRGGMKKNKTFSSKEPFNLEHLKEDVKIYQEIFNKLKEDTNTKNVGEMVKKFADFDDENYSLFNYLNVLSDELENLSRYKKHLNDEIQKYEKDEKDFKDPKVKKMIEIQEKISITKNQKKLYEQKHKDLLKIVNSLKIGIPIIFERIGCNNKDYLEEMGELFNPNDINEGNMVQFLGVIEKRTNDILQMYNEVFQKNLPEKGSKINEESVVSGSLYQINPTANTVELNSLLKNFEQEFDKIKDGYLPEKSKEWLPEKELYQQSKETCTQVKKQLKGSKQLPLKSNS